MKLNWGSGIAIFYSCFVVVMVFMVIKSAQHQTHLVQENYYHKDLNYEDFRQKRQNAADIKEQIVIDYVAAQQLVQLRFPQEMMEASGEVALFRPSNKYLDQSYRLKLDSTAQMSIPVPPSTASGLWRVKIEWESGGKQYFIEQSIVI